MTAAFIANSKNVYKLSIIKEKIIKVRMGTGLFTFLLPITLAIMMTGLGLELSPRDFIRVNQYPKAIFLALFSQQILLVIIAFLICVLLTLPPLLSVGLMLLAASPGGPTANMFSYIFKGDVALNISLTGINSLVSTFTMPFIVSLSIAYFLGETQEMAMPIEKITLIFLLIIVPVCVGMALRTSMPEFAQKMNKPMRYLSICFLAGLFLYALYQERSNVLEYFSEIGIATALFCFSGLVTGYVVPQLAGVPDKQARACAFEIGIHNTTVAMAIALTVLNSTTIAVPAAIYSIVMYVFATIFGFILTSHSSNEIISEDKF